MVLAGFGSIQLIEIGDLLKWTDLIVRLFASYDPYLFIFLLQHIRMHVTSILNNIIIIHLKLFQLSLLFKKPDIFFFSNPHLVQMELLQQNFIVLFFFPSMNELWNVHQRKIVQTIQIDVLFVLGFQFLQIYW